MAYYHFMEQGRTPEEIDDMDMLSYLKIMLWRMRDKQRQEGPRQAHVEDYI